MIASLRQSPAFFWTFPLFMKGIDNSTFVSYSNSYLRSVRYVWVKQRSLPYTPLFTGRHWPRSATTARMTRRERTILLQVMLISKCPKCRKRARLRTAYLRPTIQVGELTTSLYPPMSTYNDCTMLIDSCIIKLRQHEVPPNCVRIMFHYLCARRVVSHKDDIGCVEVVTGSQGLGHQEYLYTRLMFGSPFNISSFGQEFRDNEDSFLVSMIRLDRY